MPGDFLALRENGMRYSLLLDDNGGIIDDLMVTNRGHHFYVVVNGATKHGDIAHISARLAGGVSLIHRTDLALLALQGLEGGQGRGVKSECPLLTTKAPH